jgi:hypothetical protein
MARSYTRNGDLPAVTEIRAHAALLRRWTFARMLRSWADGHSRAWLASAPIPG